MNALVKKTTIFLFLIFFVFSCAANKPQPEVESTGEDIDNYFGIAEEEKSTTTDSDEAEVLRLLGISKDESEESKPVDEGIDQESETKLSNEISSLENQLSQKESEIANLKSEIAVKDDKIVELESSISMKARYEQSSSTGIYKDDYQNALSHYNNKNYKTAINLFEALLSKDYKSSLSDNCQYWIGECYYGLGNFNQAIVEFTKVFSFNRSNKLDDAQLKLGLCYWKLGDKSKAREEFERLVSDYPKSEYIDKAEYFKSRL